MVICLLATGYQLKPARLSNMDTVILLLLLLTVGFQFFPWYNVLCQPVNFTVTLEPFARQNRSERFLLVTEKGNEFRLSFTGKQDEQGTKFILQRYSTEENLHFRLHLAGRPDYILAEDQGKLVVKRKPGLIVQSHDTSTVDPVSNASEFLMKRIMIKIIIDSSKSRPESYLILILGSSPKVMRCNCSGGVFLGNITDWKQDWEAWFKLVYIN